MLYQVTKNTTHNCRPIERLETLQVVDDKEPVVVGRRDHRVPEQVEDDQTGQVLEVEDLADVPQLVVTDVQLNQGHGALKSYGIPGHISALYYLPKS